MALELLRELATHKLPLTVKDAGAVDQIRQLRATNCVAALTSPPKSSAPFGTVLAITRHGREVLQYAEKEKIT